jgi:hypothetical protein
VYAGLRYLEEEISKADVAGAVAVSTHSQLAFAHLILQQAQRLLH